MKQIQNLVLILLAGSLLLTGCDQAPSGGGAVAVMDLSAIAKATGQDEVIRRDAEAARGELTAQLQQLATNLEQQLAAERAKAGISPGEADQQRLQEMTMRARQEISNAQVQAQSQASLMEQELITSFREKLAPLAEEIARANGASVVLAADSYLFWVDPAVDITDEVIAAWRESSDVAASDVAEDSTDVAQELEEVETGLDQVETELSRLPVPPVHPQLEKVESELDETEKAVEELQEELQESADKTE